MPSTLANIARMTTATTGAGTVTLGSAVTGFLTFADAGISDGDVVTYAIEEGNEREIGRGTYTSGGTTLSRDTVFASTASGSQITLTGSAEVFITAAAENFDRWVSPEQYGAVGDGSTDDTTAFQAAASSGNNISTLTGNTYITTLGLATVPEIITGRGRVQITGSNKLAPNYYYIDSAPTSKGDPDSFATAFNGDLSKAHEHVGVYLTGAATLGQPSTGFESNEELSPYFCYTRNVDSGHNEELDGNDGRTTWAAFAHQGFHSGNGGMMSYRSLIFVNGEKTGATSFLASPAAANLNLSAVAGNDGVYLNPVEVNLQSGVYDVCGIGAVFNMDRDDDTGNLEAFWAGVRIQSIGSVPIDSGYQISGDCNTGLDFTRADFGTNKAAIALKALDRIYFEASASGNWIADSNGDTWIAYDSTNTGVEFFVNGTETLRVKGNSVLVRNGPLQIETGNLALQNSAAIISIGGTKVVDGRITGWEAPTGTETRTTFATSTVTLEQLAERVHALIDDLTSHGLIGA